MKLPLYICHKQVRAAKIASIQRAGDGLQFSFDDTALEPIIHGDDELGNKPLPSAGWYYVQYSNGYFSFSPAEAFEEGYSLAPVQV